MIPDFEGWKTVSAVERANTMACLNPKLNILQIYNSFNITLAVHKKVKYKLFSSLDFEYMTFDSRPAIDWLVFRDKLSDIYLR
jgi:hypothetical protein